MKLLLIVLFSFSCTVNSSGSSDVESQIQAHHVDFCDVYEVYIYDDWEGFCWAESNTPGRAAYSALSIDCAVAHHCLEMKYRGYHWDTFDPEEEKEAKNENFYPTKKEKK